MSLVSLLVIVLIIALLLWIVHLVPMDAKAKQIVSIALAVVLILWLILALVGVAPRLDVD